MFHSMCVMVRRQPWVSIVTSEAVFLIAGRAYTKLAANEFLRILLSLPPHLASGTLWLQIA